MGDTGKKKASQSSPPSTTEQEPPPTPHQRPQQTQQQPQPVNFAITHSMKIKKFDGTQDPENWFAQFERVAIANNWDQQQSKRIVPLYFYKKALRWFDNNSGNITSYIMLKRETIARFSETNLEEKKIEAFMRIKQKSNESANDYYDRFISTKREYIACVGAEDNMFSNGRVLKLYMKSIKPKAVRYYVEDKEPETLSEARKAAVKWDKRHNQGKKSRRKHKSKRNHSSSSSSEDSDSSDSSSSNDTEESDSEAESNTDSSEDEQIKRRIKKITKTNKNKKTKKEDSDNTRINDLTQRFERLELNYLNNTQRINNNDDTNIQCYNCHKIVHQAKDCDQACKICHGTLPPNNHAFYRCPNYVPRERRPVANEVKRDNLGPKNDRNFCFETIGDDDLGCIVEEPDNSYAADYDSDYGDCSLM